MAQFSELVDFVEDAINRTDLTSQVKAEINNAIEFYQSENFWFDETSATFSTVADQEDYGTADGLPSGFVEDDLIEIRINDSDYKLHKTTFEEIKRRNTSDYSGFPYWFAFYDDRIFLSPIPNQVFQINIFYRTSFSDLSADSDTNGFTDNARRLIEYRAISRLYSTRIFQNDKANTFAGLEAQELENLRQKHSNRRSSRKLQANC